jgi:hypothetical protein
MYDCARHSVCEDEPVTFYGWGRDAPEFDMPDRAGIAVGPGTKVEWIILEARAAQLCSNAHGLLRIAASTPAQILILLLHLQSGRAMQLTFVCHAQLPQPR